MEDEANPATRTGTIKGPERVEEEIKEIEGENQRQMTEVIQEPNAILAVVTGVLKRAKGTISTVAESAAVATIFTAGPYNDLVRELKSRNIGSRYITEITKDNLTICKRMMEELGIDLRHLERVKGNFVVTQVDYMRTGTIMENEPIPELVHSTIPDVIEQGQFVFDTLWERAVPALLRIGELESGLEVGMTRVTFDLGDVVNAANNFVDELKEEALVLVSREGGLAANRTFFEGLASKSAAVGAKTKVLARFSKTEIDLVKDLERRGAEVRGLTYPGLNMSLGVYDRKNMGLVQYLDSAPTAGKQINVSGVISTDRHMITWIADVFGLLWETGVPAGERIAQLERGVEPTTLRVIKDPAEVQRIFLGMIGRSRSEILLLMPTVNAYRRQQKNGALNAMLEAAGRGANVRLIMPIDASIEADVTSFGGELEKKGRPLEFRTVPEARAVDTVTILVADRDASLMIEMTDNSKPDFADAIGAATYSTSRSTVLANLRFFERLWAEIGIFEMEQRSRRTSELLQDVLSHDMKNYNQILMVNSELLENEITRSVNKLGELSSTLDGLAGESQNPDKFNEQIARIKADLAENVHSLNESSDLTRAIMKTVDNANQLINRTKNFAKIIATQDARHLEPVDLIDSIERAASLVKDAYPEKTIDFAFSVPPGATVLADSLLEEAFVNLFTNAVRYTEGPRVPIRVGVKQAPYSEAKTDHGDAEYWKVEVVDEGRGISDEAKKRAFIRYMSAASGTGLGLSIVYALVTDRYAGKIRISDTIPGDHTKGTMIEMWLPRSPAPKPPSGTA